MKPFLFFLTAICAIPALAASPHSSIPVKQNLAALDYSKDGKQTGCGLRMTAETGGDLWINILLSVFIRESEPPIGMYKVVVKKINMLNGEPVVQDGKISYSSIGKIHQAWLKTDSGIKLQPYTNGASAHGDGFMTSLEFLNAMDLLGTIPQERFKVGYGKNEDEPDEILEFDKHISQEEADKLSVCMRNLRGEMLEKKRGGDF